MDERKRGRPRLAEALDGRTVVRLTQRRFAKLERLAAREELPVAVVARRLLSERLDAMDDERKDHNDEEEQRSGTGQYQQGHG